jgi:hypothetical protein
VLLVRDPGAAPKRPHDKPETNGSPQEFFFIFSPFLKQISILTRF